MLELPCLNHGVASWCGEFDSASALLLKEACGTDADMYSGVLRLELDATSLLRSMVKLFGNRGHNLYAKGDGETWEQWATLHRPKLAGPHSITRLDVGTRQYATFETAWTCWLYREAQLDYLDERLEIKS